MMQKRFVLLLIPILLLACRKAEPATGTDTVSTDTAATTATAPAAAPDTIAPPPAHVVDHYKFWKVKPLPFPHRAVKLKGQFDREAWEGRIGTPMYLGNPVEKNGEPILKQDWHLLSYTLKGPPQPPRTVVIENQFRKGETWQISDAAWLLVPAAKSLEAPPKTAPQGADHYVCYIAKPADPVPGPVKLFDQFDKKRGKTEEVSKLTAAYFCVPAEKNGEPIYNPREHLAIYTFEPRDPFAIRVFTLDQFGAQRLQVENSELLAVPTWKLDWK